MSVIAEYMATTSNAALRTLYRHRNLSNPTEGNRTPLAVGCCIVLLALMCVALFQVEFSSLYPDVGRSYPTGYLARHVMGMFVIVLFLLIDGSPETLALGLFLGCESVARSIDYGWISTPYPHAVQHYLFQMGDILRLYFATQIARLTPKHLWPWIKYGTLLSIPYAIAMETSPIFRTDFSHSIRALRDVLIGLAGSWLCLRVAIAIWKDNLPWRIVALLVASFAFLESPFNILWDVVTNGESSHIVKVALGFYRTTSYYLFALSAFINISTIENRIRALSSAKAEQRLEKLREEQRVHEAIAKTTQMLAHDVRKPFSLVKAYMDTLSEAKTTEEARAILGRMIPDVQRNLKTVDQLISDVMDIGRDMTPKVRPISVQSLMGFCIEEAFKTSRNSNIRFSYHFRHRGHLLGDEQQLQRIFINIFENAEQAIGGKLDECITISTFNDSGPGGDRISIEIHNTGSYIPKADLKSIFDAFFTKGKRNGTGLGLAIVKKLVTAHGGEVSANSDQDTGTSFRFTLPANFTSAVDTTPLPRSSAQTRLKTEERRVDFQQRSHVQSALESRAENPNSKSFITVMIIDDEEAYAAGVKAKIKHLLPPSATILIEANPRNAISRLHRYLPNLVISDFHFVADALDGIDILTEAKQASSSCITALHTNHILTPETLNRGTNVVDVRIAKPLTQGDLNILIQRLTIPVEPLEVAVVEDDYAFADAAKNQLKEYKVHLFENPEDFEAAVHADVEFLQRLVAVVTDQNFADTATTGLDLATKIRHHHHLQIVLYTNQTMGLKAGPGEQIDLIVPKGTGSLAQSIRPKRNRS